MGGGVAMQNWVEKLWLDRCRAGDWLSFPVDMSSPCKSGLFTSACQEEAAAFRAKPGNQDL